MKEQKEVKKPKALDMIMGLVIAGVIGFGFYYCISLISF